MKHALSQILGKLKNKDILIFESGETIMFGFFDKTSLPTGPNPNIKLQFYTFILEGRHVDHIVISKTKRTKKCVQLTTPDQLEKQNELNSLAQRKLVEQLRISFSNKKTAKFFFEILQNCKIDKQIYTTYKNAQNLVTLCFFDNITPDLCDTVFTKLACIEYKIASIKDLLYKKLNIVSCTPDIEPFISSSGLKTSFPTGPNPKNKLQFYTLSVNGRYIDHIVICKTKDSKEGMCHATQLKLENQPALKPIVANKTINQLRITFSKKNAAKLFLGILQNCNIDENNYTFYKNDQNLITLCFIKDISPELCTVIVTKLACIECKIADIKDQLYEKLNIVNCMLGIDTYNLSPRLQ